MHNHYFIYVLAHYDTTNGFSFGKNENVELNEDTISLLNDNDIDKISIKLDEVTGRYSNASKESLKFAQSIRDGKVQLKDGQTYLQAYEAQLKSTGFSFKNIGSMAKNFFGTLGAGLINAAGGMAIGALVSGGISLIGKFFDSLIETEKEIREAAEKAQQKIDEATDSFKNASETIEENKERFLELSKGVNEYSKNIRLSEEDYKEYLSISQKLADISPSLIVGYDEQGNALLNIGKNAEETNKKLLEVLETEYAIQKQTVIDNLDDVAKGIRLDVKKAKEELDNAKNELNYYESKLKNGANGYYLFNDEDYKKHGKALEKIFDSLDINFQIDKKAGIYQTGIQIIGSITEEQKKQIQDLYEEEFRIENETYKASQASLKKDIQAKENLIKSHYSKMTSNLQIWVSENSNYQYLADGMQNIINSLIPSIQWDELGIPLIDGDDYTDYITEHIINPLMNIPEEQRGKFSVAFNKLLSFKEGDLDILPFAESLTQQLKELGIEINIEPIIANEKDAKERLQASIQAITGVDPSKPSDYRRMSQNAKDEYDILQKFTKDFNATEIEMWLSIYDASKSALENIEAYNTEKVKSVKKISFSEAFNSADFSEQKEKLLELARAGELTPETLESTEEYNTLLSQTGLSAESVKDKIYDLLTAQEKLAGTHNGLDSLTNSYKEFKDLGFVTAQTLEDLPDVFRSLEGYDVFSQIVGDPQSGIDTIQQAFNDIVKEYLMLTQVFNSDDLISDDLETQQRAMSTYMANLKEMGITNAEEVVKQTVSSMKQQQTLLDNAEQEYIDYLTGKNNVDLEYIESTASYNSQFINALGEGYQTDYDNWVNSLAEKKKAYELFSAELEAISLSNDGFKIDQEKLKNGTYSEGQLLAQGLSLGNVTRIMEVQAKYRQARDESDEFKEKLKESFVFNPTFTSDFSPEWNGLDSSSSNTSKSDTYFDWIETKLDKLNDQLDKTKEKAEDSLNGWKIRADAFTDAENQINDLIATQEEARARYLEEANKSGLPDEYKELVQDGAIDIDKLSNDNPLKEQIESYQEWYDKVKQCDEAIDELNTDLKQLYRDKREFRWEIFDYLEDSISRITDEADYLVELLSNEDLFDDKGNMTKYADATLGLHFSNIDTYMQKAKDCEEEIKDLEGQLATGGQEVLDKYNERVDAHQEAINAAKNERDAILDLVENSYQKQLDYLNEIIDKKKESLNAEKD